MYIQKLNPRSKQTNKGKLKNSKKKKKKREARTLDNKKNKYIYLIKNLNTGYPSTNQSKSTKLLYFC